jgi:PEP-CTERM motif
MKSSFLLCALLALASLAARPVEASILYDNDFGVGNFSTNGWNVTLGSYSVADSFVLSTAGTIDSVQLAFWTYPGDTVTSVYWSFLNDDGIDPLSGSVIESGIANPQQVSQFQNGSGYFNISIETFSVPDLILNLNTTYWLAITADTLYQDGLYWDESDGPSIGYQNSPSYIPSESFQLLGTDPVPEPGVLALVGGGLMVLALLRRRKN